jgi:hypothetical protein
MTTPLLQIITFIEQTEWRVLCRCIGVSYMFKAYYTTHRHFDKIWIHGIYART